MCFEIDEWYHCFNRGVDKRRTFESVADYRRMQELLYLTNAETPIHRSDKVSIDHNDLFSISRDEQLVDVAAYCLMPNHFHLLLRPHRDGSISAFMRKLMTAYTMYFNIKNERVGNLFYKPFRSKHVPDDRYGQHVYNYIHANPSELCVNESQKTIAIYIESYPYSSLVDRIANNRPERTILTPQRELPFKHKNGHDILADTDFLED